MKNINKIICFNMLVSAVAAAGFSGVVAAEGFAIEEVIVTSQKREENAQDVGIAITAFSEGHLDKIGAKNIEDVAYRTPGLNFNSFTDLKLSATTLRGISADSGSAGGDPSVGYYLDEVYLGPGVGANIDLFDVESIEVLRGPQGTLFGRNTIGGVISITSKKPSDELTSYLQTEYGNYNHTRIKGSVSGPLIDNLLSASLAAVYYDRDAYIDNEYLNTGADGTHQKGARVAFRYMPVEDAEFLLSIDYRKVTQRSKSMETLRYNPSSIATGFEMDLNALPDDRKVFSNFFGNEKLESWGGMLRGTISFDDVDLVSVTGYREHDYFNLGDTDMTPLRLIRDGDPEKVRRFSQELRLVSNNDSDLNWIVGLYYSDQSTENNSIIELREDLLASFGFSDAVFSGGSLAEMNTKNYAVFANLNYSLGDSFELMLGLRQTYEEKDIDYRQVDFESELGFPMIGGSFSRKARDDWSSFTPMLTLRYHADEDVMLYGTISRGFKSGGFNDALGSGDGISFDPEVLLNYELGIKSTWFDQRLIMNAALFHMDWKDIQLSSDNPNTPNTFDPIIANAGRAHSTGMELETLARVTGHLTLGADFSVTEAEYDEGTLISGNPLEKLRGVPKYKVGLNAEYVFPVFDSMELSLRGDYIRQGDIYLGLDQSIPEVKEGAYSMFNARVTLASHSDDWRLALWGKNLTDETYRVRYFDLFENPLVGQSFSVLGSPRTYGVEVRFNF